jgi:hypothetical protein
LLATTEDLPIALMARARPIGSPPHLNNCFASLAIFQELPQCKILSLFQRQNSMLLRKE